MEIASAVFNLINDPIKAGLAALNITPDSYAFIFPPGYDPVEVNKLVAQGVFPTVEGLAPALTFFVILNLTRYFLTVSIFQVSISFPILCCKHSYSNCPCDNTFFVDIVTTQPLARAAMQIKEIPLVRIKEVDVEFKDVNKFVDVSSFSSLLSCYCDT